MSECVGSHAETICRILGGDLTLVDEIQRRHTQVAGTAEEGVFLADVQGPQQAISHKRTLEDDDEVYAAKKQQMLRQIKQEGAGTELTMIKQHAICSTYVLGLKYNQLQTDHAFYEGVGLEGKRLTISLGS